MRVAFYRVGSVLSEDTQRQLFGVGASMRDTRVVQCLVATANEVEEVLTECGVCFESIEFTPKRMKGLGGTLIANHISWATHKDRGRGNRTDGRHWYG